MDKRKRKKKKGKEKGNHVDLRLFLGFLVQKVTKKLIMTYLGKSKVRKCFILDPNELTFE